MANSTASARKTIPVSEDAQVPTGGRESPLHPVAREFGPSQALPGQMSVIETSEQAAPEIAPRVGQRTAPPAKTPTPVPRPAPSRAEKSGGGAFFRIYFAAWAFLAAGALAYLTLLTMHPTLIASPVPQPVASNPENERNLTRVLTEMRTVSRSLSDLQKEVGQIRTSVTVLEDRDKAILARLTGVEERSHSAEATPVVQSAATSSRAPDAKNGARPLTGPTIQGYVEDGRSATVGRPDPAPKIVATTPSSPTPPTSPQPTDAAEAPVVIGPGIVTSSSQPVSIQIGSGPSLDSVRLTWSLLVERHRAHLRRLEPRVIPGSSMSDPPYQLLAGPIATAQEAQKVCQALRAKRVECTVVPGLVGETL